MFSKVSFLAVLAVGAYLSVSIHDAEALMCYSCNGSSTPNCNTPFNATNIDMPTCGADEQCVKVNFKPANTSETLSWRGCTAGNQTCDTINSTWSGLKEPLSFCSVCKKDHCNSATNFAVPLVAMVVSLLAVKFVQ